MITIDLESRKMKKIINFFGTGQTGFILFIRDSVMRDFKVQATKLIYDQLMENLDNADTLFTPLTAAWLKRKMDEGWDTKIWHMTHTLRENVRVEITIEGVFVGWSELDNHPEHGFGSLAEVARSNEYGDLDVGKPERPLVRLTHQQVGPKIRPLFYKIAAKHVAAAAHTFR